MLSQSIKVYSAASEIVTDAEPIPKVPVPQTTRSGFESNSVGFSIVPEDSKNTYSSPLVRYLWGLQSKVSSNDPASRIAVGSTSSGPLKQAMRNSSGW